VIHPPVHRYRPRRRGNVRIGRIGETASCLAAGEVEQRGSCGGLGYALIAELFFDARIPGNLLRCQLVGQIAPSGCGVVGGGGGDDD